MSEAALSANPVFALSVFGVLRGVASARAISEDGEVNTVVVRIFFVEEWRTRLSGEKMVERGEAMESRIDQRKVSPGAIKAMLGLEGYVNKSGLDQGLANLVRLRVSQINGCAFCIDMHAKDLRAAGETEQRIYELDAWRETPFYSEREQAALAWAEAVTLIRDGHVPDDIYEQARAQFSEQELVDLTLAVVAINGWNRLNIAFRTVPGSYKPGQVGKLVAELAA